MLLITLCGFVALAVVLHRRFPFAAIYRSKWHLQAAFDSFNDPLAIINQDYTIERVNHAYTLLVDRPYEQLIGKCCYTVLRKRAHPCSDCRLAETILKQSRTQIEASPHPIDHSADAAISLVFFPFNPVKANSRARASVVEHIHDQSPLQRVKRQLEKKNRDLRTLTARLQAAQEQFNEELALAREVQQSILPTTIPQPAGIQIMVAYKPITEVGGDLYDFIPFSESRLGIFIGDASGHGLSAALVSMLSKMSLYNHTRTEPLPQELLSELNADLIRHIHTGHYLTCFWAVLDSTTLEMDIARGGHPKPVVVRANGTVVELGGEGTLVGILQEAVYESMKFTCQPGDRIYLFTDGIYMTEITHGRKQTAFNKERFCTMLRECSNLPFNLVIPTIRKRLSQYTCEDDYTLILIEIEASN
jgi:sigma-B regulation protein RsbU (phosphoserine phosphatase)